VGERRKDERSATVRAAIAKLDLAVERNSALENQLAAAYAELKTVAETLAEVRAELVHLDGAPG
jgi:hypothetical protein